MPRSLESVLVMPGCEAKTIFQAGGWVKVEEMEAEESGAFFVILAIEAYYRQISQVRRDPPLPAPNLKFYFSQGFPVYGPLILSPGIFIEFRFKNVGESPGKLILRMSGLETTEAPAGFLLTPTGEK